MLALSRGNRTQEESNIDGRHEMLDLIREEELGSAIIADARSCEGIDKVMFKGKLLYDKSKDTGKESDESGAESTMVREPESYGDGSARGRARMMKDLGSGISSFLDDDDDVTHTTTQHHTHNDDDDTRRRHHAHDHIHAKLFRGR